MARSINRPTTQSAVAGAVADFARPDAAALRERVIDYVYPVCCLVFAFVPLAYLVCHVGDLFLHPGTHLGSIVGRIVVGLVLILLAFFVRQPAGRRHLPLVWVLYVLAVQIGTTLSAIGSPQGLNWALPAFVLAPVVCAPFWPTRGSLAIACALAILAPGAALLIGHASDAEALRYAIYLFIALTITIILAAAMVRVHARGYALDQRLRAAAFFDHLTGVLSRHRFFELGTRAVERGHLTSTILSVLYIDVDHFKNLNDDLGHEAGDKALSLIAGALSTELRAGDLLGRVGGEEFVVLLPAVSVGAALLAAERLRYTVSHIDYRQRPLSVSIGVAGLKAGQDLDALLREADTALRRAKLAGRNRVEQAASDGSDSSLLVWRGRNRT